jgi:hypothetical protein
MKMICLFKGKSHGNSHVKAVPRGGTVAVRFIATWGWLSGGTANGTGRGTGWLKVPRLQRVTVPYRWYGVPVRALPKVPVNRPYRTVVPPYRGSTVRLYGFT